MRFWTKKTGLVPAVAAFAVILSGCELEVLNPGAIQDADLTDPELMPILVNGVSAEFNDFYDDVAFDVAILADEMAGTGSYSGTQEYRQGFWDQEDSEGNWASTHEANWAADQAIERLIQVSDDPENDFDYGTSVDAARAWAIKGFSNISLGENFCYAVYGVGNADSRAAAFDTAAAAFVQADAFARASGSDDWEVAAAAGAAQAEFGRAVWGSGSWAQAATLAQAAIDLMPDNQWSNDAIYNTTADNNIFWNETWGRAEYNVFRTLAEQLHTQNDDPRTEFKICGDWNDTSGQLTGGVDPRTLNKTELDQLVSEGVTPSGACAGEGSGAHQGADGEHAHYKQMIYTERGSNIPRVSWDEMKLIQAEAALEANDIPGFVARINELRAKHGLTAYVEADVVAATPGDGLNFPHDLTSLEAIDILDRERYASLWLQGRRLHDMDRWNHPFMEGGDNVYGPGLGNWVIGGSSFAPRASCMPIARSECLLNENISGNADVCG